MLMLVLQRYEGWISSAHRDAGGSVMTFLVRLLELDLHGGNPDGTIRAVLVPRAPTLVRLLLAGAGGALPSARFPQISEIVYELLKVRRYGVRELVKGGGRCAFQHTSCCA